MSEQLKQLFSSPSQALESDGNEYTINDTFLDAYFKADSPNTTPNSECDSEFEPPPRKRSTRAGKRKYGAKKAKSPRRRGRPVLDRSSDPVFSQFDPTDEKAVFACKICKKLIKSMRGSKTSLKIHLNLHRKKGAPTEQANAKAWITAGIVAELNLPCNAFKSPYMAELFERAKLGAINDKIARRLTDLEAEKAFSHLGKELVKLRDAGAVFTLTADEWTWHRKRFVGITLHCSQAIPYLDRKSIELLSRFSHRADAQNLQAALSTSLKQVGLELSDLRGMTTDAASVMVKLGRDLQQAIFPRPFYHQLCFAHALHLAVRDTFKGQEGADTEQYDLPESMEPGPASWRFVEVLNDDDEGTVEDEEEKLAGHPVLCGRSGELVNKVRTICRDFQRKVTLNDEFNTYCQESAPERKLKLVLDVQTRWGSTHRMLRHFLELAQPLRLFFASRLGKEFPLSSDELSTIEGLTECLGHVETASKRLSETETTLRNCDIALEVMLTKLEGEKSEFARALYKNLCIRIRQRRGVASRLARFLRRKSEDTPLDCMLAKIEEEVSAEGKEKLVLTFADKGSMVDEVAKFQSLQKQTVSKQQELKTDSGLDDFDRLKDADEEDRGLIDYSAKKLIRMHKHGVQVLPELLYKTMETLQPSSVPAERMFSKARHARRYSQESLDDDRFASYVFLKDYYAKSKPWHEKRQAALTEQHGNDDEGD